jgi:hypothetical protein
VIGEWMLASTMVASLMCGMAIPLQRVATLYAGVAIRWIWVGAIVGAAALPVVWLAGPPQRARTPVALQRDDSVAPLDSPASTQTLGAPAERSWSSKFDGLTFSLPRIPPRADRPLALAWCGFSGLLLVASLGGAVQLSRDQRRRRTCIVTGQTVLVSSDFGPAVVGVLRPRIVVPTWVLHLDEGEQLLIVRHEAEHLAAHDPALLHATLGLLILAPWNLGLWLLWRGLRRAVEIDCDARVLRHGVERADYANVLLHASTYGHVGRFASMAFAAPATSLSTRIEHLMRPTPRRRAMKTIAGVLAAVLAIALVGAMRAPRQAGSTQTLSPVCMSAFVAACTTQEVARFGDTRKLVVADRLESNPVAWVRVSSSEEVRERQDAHFFIAFIVDTAGRVERGSITFVGEAPEVFRHPRCAEVMNYRFRPVRRAGVARRAFMIHGFDFWPGGHTASRPTANMLFDSTRAAVFGHGTAAAVEQLKTRPHC